MREISYIACAAQNSPITAKPGEITHELVSALVVRPKTFRLRAAEDANHRQLGGEEDDAGIPAPRRATAPHRLPSPEALATSSWATPVESAGDAQDQLGRVALNAIRGPVHSR